MMMNPGPLLRHDPSEISTQHSCITKFLYSGRLKNFKKIPHSMKALRFFLPADSLVTKSCPTLATPWIEEPGRLQAMGFSRQEYWSGLPCPSPGALCNP